MAPGTQSDLAGLALLGAVIGYQKLFAAAGATPPAAA